MTTKTKQAHTPGPWQSRLGNGALKGFWRVFDMDGNSIADPLKVGSEEMTNANAALIAQAPSLLEALKVLLRRYDFQEDDQAQAEEAIRKAEGNA